MTGNTVDTRTETVFTTGMTRTSCPPVAEFHIELRSIDGRKPWLLVAYLPDGRARIISDHASRNAAMAAARKRGIAGLVVRP